MKSILVISILSTLSLTACQLTQKSNPTSAVKDAPAVATDETDAPQGPLDAAVLKKMSSAAEAAYRQEVKLEPSDQVVASIRGVYVSEPTGDITSTKADWSYNFIMSSSKSRGLNRSLNISFNNPKAVFRDDQVIGAGFGPEESVIFLPFSEIKTWVQKSFDSGCMKSEDSAGGHRSAYLELHGEMTGPRGVQFAWGLICANAEGMFKGKNAKTGEEFP